MQGLPPRHRGVTGPRWGVCEGCEKVAAGGGSWPGLESRGRSPPGQERLAPFRPRGTGRLRWVGAFVNPSCNNPGGGQEASSGHPRGTAGTGPSQIRDPNRCRLR